MKKLALSLLVFGVFLGISGCGSNANEGGKISSNSVEESTTDSSDKEDKKMEAMEEDLKEKGVSVRLAHTGYMYFNREKSVDYDYFEMIFKFSKSKVFQVTLGLKGNIDGKKKDDLYYEVNQGRIVESSIYDSNINSLAEVLESIGYSDKEMLEFAQWYYDNSK
ncbi:hypothetical protein IW492_01895 [Enterococcus sp. BWB1-3]|uniref:hypothetical protein n=1 Tax=Enterococcus sp. BWB1-3 TaxID=2787713 RepID=UPI0019227A16|nr:hypothetical protein [Enterococcus sp. BWB1-3]MBL1227981.1 hypothetical protein [Enterococcus sp. BWB1-3]